MKDTLCRFFHWVFSMTMPLFMVIGFIMIVVQLAGVLTHNPNMILWGKNTFKNASLYISCITGFAGYFYYYLKPKKK